MEPANKTKISKSLHQALQDNESLYKKSIQIALYKDLKHI